MTNDDFEAGILFLKNFEKILPGCIAFVMKKDGKIKKEFMGLDFGYKHKKGE